MGNDKAASLKRPHFNLEHQEWYHGYRPKADTDRLLTEPGDFLVRAMDDGKVTELILSICSEERKPVNILMRYSAPSGPPMWRIATSSKSSSRRRKAPSDQSFSTICELVEHYRCHPPSKHLKLRNGVPRPKWLVKHEMVAFDRKADLLGTGNFCNVYKGRLKMSDDLIKTVAVKTSIGVEEEEKGGKIKEEARNVMLHEAELMAYFSHDNVLAMYGLACDHPPVFIVTEFCPGGDLRSHLVKHGDSIDTPERLLYLVEAARGMNYLHKKGCVHRNLAARNCLISEKGIIKIADFGMSKLVEAGEAVTEEKSKIDQLPLQWLSPESIKRPHVFSKKSDVWTFGVLIFEVLSNGVAPFKNVEKAIDIARSIRAVEMPDLPPRTPPLMKDLVRRLWVKNPDLRPSMFTILIVVRNMQMLIGDVRSLSVNKINAGVKRINISMEDSSEFENDSSRCSAKLDCDRMKGESPVAALAAREAKRQSVRRDPNKIPLGKLCPKNSSAPILPPLPYSNRNLL